MNNPKYRTALIIGRFQPFHFGHLYLIQKALEISEKLIIGIGSSNVYNSDNPFSFSKRKKMVEMVFAREKIEDKLIKIVALPDIPNDDLWLKNVLSKVPKFDLVIGNNDWVNSIFRNVNYRVLEVPYYKRYLYEGEKIRRLMREGKKWQDRVPRYLRAYLAHPKGGLA